MTLEKEEAQPRGQTDLSVCALRNTARRPYHLYLTIRQILNTCIFIQPNRSGKNSIPHYYYYPSPRAAAGLRDSAGDSLSHI